MEKTKCYYCGEKHFLETFKVPWWAEIVAKDAKGTVLFKWKDELAIREITLCPSCSAIMANFIKKMDESYGEEYKND